MKLSNHGLKALSLSVATIALATAPAFASGPTPIYAGGGTLAFSRLKALGECASGILLSGNPSVDAKDKADTAQDPSCTTVGSNGYDYLFIGVGSGAGQDALLTETSPSVAPGGIGGPSESNVPYDDVANGFTYFNSTTGKYGFPSWVFTDSDAPMDSLSNLNDGNTFLTDYTSLTAGNGAGTGTVKQARGLPWQLPDAATDIGLVYSTTNLTFVNTSSNPTWAAANPGLAQEADLSVDMICYIWTKATAGGTVPAGNYDWSNSIFSAQYERVGTKEVQITYGSEVTPTSGSQALQPVHRLDDSGSSYLFTLWLSQNCANYTAAGYTTPATSASTFPSFVIPATATGTGGEIATTTATAGGIGYSGPANIAPAAPTGPTAAFLFSLVSKVTAPQKVYPSSTANPNPGIVAAFTKVAPPVVTTNPAGLVGTSTKAWGTGLNKAFFRSKTSGAYPITGLTYIMGYQCYSADTGSDNYDGVLDYVQFLTSNVQAPKILAQGGLVSLDYDTTKNSKGLTMLQAEYNVLDTDSETALVGITSSEIFPNPNSPTHPFNGPSYCRDYRLDPNRT